ncbi:hypothetical protein EYF80_022106 [Liparis tanakae]|uniref:Uncharacterized protein n=1 Tax=Liparis tanakae TaxID=230148 RepID=A0A4Z2HS57_9TELE|nr:hypothetical protein EYF80_022106 [Liparis tanakae]
MGKSKVIAGSHFGIFTKPAGHCGGQTHRVLPLLRQVGVQLSRWAVKSSSFNNWCLFQAHWLIYLSYCKVPFSTISSWSVCFSICTFLRNGTPFLFHCYCDCIICHLVVFFHLFVCCVFIFFFFTSSFCRGLFNLIDIRFIRSTSSRVIRLENVVHRPPAVHQVQGHRRDRVAGREEGQHLLCAAASIERDEAHAGNVYGDLRTDGLVNGAFMSKTKHFLFILDQKKTFLSP